MEVNYSYNEKEILDIIGEYVDSTYNQHYVGKGEIQTVDIWDTMNIAEENCIGNVIKYATRFGKKEGKNKKDLVKLIHYAILAYYYAFKDEGLELNTNK